MKRIYDILILAIALIVISLIYPVGLGIPTPSNSYINCTEWYKINTGVCDDFSDPLVNLLLIILIPIIALTGIIVLFVKPKKKE